MDLEGMLIKSDSNERPVEPERGSGGGDGGCVHPQCSIERAIEASSIAIVESISGMALAEWDLSPVVTERLRALVGFLIDWLDADEQAPAETIGNVYPLLPKDDGPSVPE